MGLTTFFSCDQTATFLTNSAHQSSEGHGRMKSHVRHIGHRTPKTMILFLLLPRSCSQAIPLVLRLCYILSAQSPNHIPEENHRLLRSPRHFLHARAPTSGSSRKSATSTRGQLSGVQAITPTTTGPRQMKTSPHQSPALRRKQMTLWKPYSWTIRAES